MNSSDGANAGYPPSPTVAPLNRKPSNEVSKTTHRILFDRLDLRKWSYSTVVPKTNPKLGTKCFSNLISSY